jgi:hypothetical protein
MARMEQLAGFFALSEKFSGQSGLGGTVADILASRGASMGINLDQPHGSGLGRTFLGRAPKKSP